MIRPNELSNPGENAALARVEAVLASLDATPVERFAVSRKSVLDPDTHARLLASVESEADRCGRRELLDDVRERVRATLAHRYSPLASVTGVGFSAPVNAAARPGDEAVVIMAVTDALAVAVVEDRLDARVAAQLAEPGRQLLGMPPLGEAGTVQPGPAVPEPSAADWAEAAAGNTRVGGYSPIPVTLRIVVATVAACTIGPAAVFAGVAGGSTLMGILAGLAVVALCWLLATYQR